MKNKKLIVIAVVLVAVVAILLGIYAGTRPQTAAGEKNYTVTVVHSDGSSVEFNYSTDEEYLGASLVAEGLIQGEEGPYGLTVYTVDGEDAVWEENGAYWALFVGEEYGTAGVDTTPVYDGSSFSLVYTLG